MTTPKDEKGAEPALTPEEVRAGWGWACCAELIARRATPPGELDSARVREAASALREAIAGLHYFASYTMTPGTPMQIAASNAVIAMRAALASLKGEAP